MPTYKYECTCGEKKEVTKRMALASVCENCHVCDERMRKVITAVSYIGGTDGFKNANNRKPFIHEGREIETWKEWEQAGYRDAKEFHTGDVKEGIKRKENKIRKYDSGKKFSVQT